jgi:NAD(P)H-hydrate epimerase
MIRITTIAETRAIEAEANANGITYDDMMKRAGQATAKHALSMLKHLPDPQITLLIGAGNNGGDGILTGLFMAQANEKALVRFYLLKERPDDPYLDVAKQAGLFIAYATDDKDKRLLRNMVASADLVIDALFGIGVRLPIRDEAQAVLRAVNQALNERQRDYDSDSTQPLTTPKRLRAFAPIRVLAVDVPSGLDADSGRLDKNAIHADETLTFITAKYGQLTFEGAQAVGQLSVNTLGIPAKHVTKHSQNTALPTLEDAVKCLPPRPLDGHKGTFGKAVITGGAKTYYGAILLAAQGAYRAGAGLVAIGAPQAHVQTLAPYLQEAIWYALTEANSLDGVASQALPNALDGADALLIGCGMGQEATSAHFLNSILQTQLPPLVLDADALNLLSRMPNWHSTLPKDTILTPHPAEMARLCGVETQTVQAQRWQIAREKAQAWGVVLVLKGAHTLVANPEGEIVAIPFKSDALATAGTGDVLAGIITGLLAQGLKAFEAAWLGAYLHGLAGKLAGQRLNSRAVLARDVVESLHEAFTLLES